MLKTGAEHLESLRDGRVVYIGSEKVDDVTTHPAFRNAARSMAAIYDIKRADPRFSFEEGGERFSSYFLRSKSKEDLQKRTDLHRAIAAMSHGLLGRSPDHVSSFVTGMSMNPEVFKGFAKNLLKYYEEMRARDLYGVYAVLPPQAARNPEFYVKQNIPVPSLRVVREDDDGVVITGMKMLATGAVFADEVWIGNLTAIDDKRQSESITCALPISTSGVSFWAREPYERHARHEADYPLSYRFDETDTVLVCDRVKVPWDRVFLHNNGAMSRRIYIETPANCYQNQQSNVRFWAKMGLIVGLASRMCQANGVDRIPAVRETLGRLAALEATIGGLVNGQIEACEQWPDGYATPNRRIMYATLNWCQEHHTEIIDALRTLAGAAPLQMPASIDLVADRELKERFERWWSTPALHAVDRLKLYKLAWDLIGSEFAGRHMLYERFYAGNSIIVRNQSDREAPWEKFHAIVDGLLQRIEAPG